MESYISNLIFLLALINPVSKIFVVSMLSEHKGKGEINRIIIRSSIIAGTILVIFALSGNFILHRLFHVQIYSLQIIGGIVLAVRGFQALNKGVFFEVDRRRKLDDVSIVPIASPMIAGPATIAAAVSFPAHYGMLKTVIPLVGAIAINFVIMFFSKEISRYLKRYNLYGAFIRIAGLLVATIGTQMILNGFSAYMSA